MPKLTTKKRNALSNRTGPFDTFRSSTAACIERYPVQVVLNLRFSAVICTSGFWAGAKGVASLRPQECDPFPVRAPYGVALNVARIIGARQGFYGARGPVIPGDFPPCRVERLKKTEIHVVDDVDLLFDRRNHILSIGRDSRTSAYAPLSPRGPSMSMPSVPPSAENEWQLMQVGMRFMTTGADGFAMSRIRQAMDGISACESGWTTPSLFRAGMSGTSR